MNRQSTSLFEESIYLLNTYKTKKVGKHNRCSGRISMSYCKYYQFKNGNWNVDTFIEVSNYIMWFTLFGRLLSTPLPGLMSTF